MNTFFFHQIKHTNGVFEKGIVVKDGESAEANFEAARQAYHAYLGAYAYGHDPATDYVQCMITDISGQIIAPFAETWAKVEPEPEPEPEA